MEIWTFTEGYFHDERPGMVTEAGDCIWKNLKAGEVSYILSSDGSRKLLVDGQETDPPDFFTIQDYSNATFPLARHLEEMGSVNITGSQAIRICRSKMEAYELMVSAGVPCAKTIAVAKGITADYLIQELSLPFILKPDSGFGGKDVALIKTREEAIKELSDITEDSPLMLAQKFVATSKGRDLRVITVGESAVIGVLRQAGDENEFRSNLQLGGKASRFELTDRIKELAVSAAKAVGLGFSGVDLLFAGDDFVIGEINPSPGINQDFKINVMLPEMKKYADKLRKEKRA